MIWSCPREGGREGVSDLKLPLGRMGRGREGLILVGAGFLLKCWSVRVGLLCGRRE